MSLWVRAELSTDSRLSGEVNNLYSALKINRVNPSGDEQNINWKIKYATSRNPGETVNDCRRY